MFMIYIYQPNYIFDFVYEGVLCVYICMKECMCISVFIVSYNLFYLYGYKHSLDVCMHHVCIMCMYVCFFLYRPIDAFM